jgi:hypothetical protein
MQSLYQARDPFEAQLLHDYLRDRHIATVVLGDYLAGAAGQLPAINFPVVWVLEDGDLPRARQLLEEFLAEGESQVPWRCPACGETVDGGLLLCWNCGAGRPE